MIKWRGSSFVIFVFFVVRHQTIDANLSFNDNRLPFFAISPPGDRLPALGSGLGRRIDALATRGR